MRSGERGWLANLSFVFYARIVDPTESSRRYEQNAESRVDSAQTKTCQLSTGVLPSAPRLRNRLVATRGLQLT